MTMTKRDALLIQLAEDLQQELHGAEECLEDALGNAVAELLGQLAHATAFDGPFPDGSFAAAYEARARQLAGGLRQSLRQTCGIDGQDAAADLAAGLDDDDQLVEAVDQLLRRYGKDREPAARAFLFRRMAGAFGEPRSTDPSEVAEDAGLAFWRLVADTFPQATAGDVEPGVSLRLDEAARDAVANWIALSVPESD